MASHFFQPTQIPSRALAGNSHYADDDDENGASRSKGEPMTCRRFRFSLAGYRALIPETWRIVAFRQRMQGLARKVFLGDLTLELSAVGAVLSLGFHPPKAR
jgi:hypothetical protein